jgi:hypothetical protein
LNTKARAYFHKIITVLFERVSCRQVQRPFSLDITEIMTQIEARFSQRATLDFNGVIVLLNDYRGFISGIRRSDNYTIVFSRYIEEGVSAFIIEVVQAYSSYRQISKSVLDLLIELSHGVQCRITKNSKT